MESQQQIKDMARRGIVGIVVVLVLSFCIAAASGAVFAAAYNNQVRDGSEVLNVSAMAAASASLLAFIIAVSFLLGLVGSFIQR